MNAEREKCNTSLSQANSCAKQQPLYHLLVYYKQAPTAVSKQIFFMNKLGDIFFFSPPPPRKAIACKPSRVNAKKPSAPANLGSAAVRWTSGAVRGAAGVISGLLLEIPLGDLLSFAFPRLACTGRLRNVPFVND